MRRKRKSQGVWFPVLGQDGPTDYPGLSSQTGQLAGLAGLGPGCYVLPLVPDRAVEGDSYGPGGYDLSAAIGNSYILKRIVGKFHAAVFQDDSSGAPGQVKIGLGFLVARTDGDEVLNPTGLPVGGIDGVGTRQNYNVLGRDQVNDPWIWRRTWILQNNEKIATDRYGIFPSTTAGYGSVSDGPHIDAKSRRRVSQDERLYAAITLQAWPQVGGPYEYTVSPYINYDLDLRVFGLPIKSRNRGAF